nr:hypothetical protein DVH24_006737 [Ipomoea trifida]
MRVIFPGLRLRHRRALHVEVKLAPAAVENESVAGVPARVARELPIGVRRRGEERERVLGVRGVPDLARQVEARVVEDEAAAWLGARSATGLRNQSPTGSKTCGLVSRNQSATRSESSLTGFAKPVRDWNRNQSDWFRKTSPRLYAKVADWFPDGGNQSAT